MCHGNSSPTVFYRSCQFQFFFFKKRRKNIQNVEFMVFQRIKKNVFSSVAIFFFFFFFKLEILNDRIVHFSFPQHFLEKVDVRRKKNSLTRYWRKQQSNIEILRGTGNKTAEFLLSNLKENSLRFGIGSNRRIQAQKNLYEALMQRIFAQLTSICDYFKAVTKTNWL